jgi:hypothetical protein
MVLLKTLKCGAVLACGVLALVVLTASGGEKQDGKGKSVLSGVWVQAGGELKIEFSGKEVMKVFPHGENQVIIVICKYTLDEKGLIKARVTEFDGKDEVKQKIQQHLPLGTEFGFTWQVKGDIATLELKGNNLPQVLKTHLPGKFEKK